MSSLTNIEQGAAVGQARLTGEARLAELARLKVVRVALIEGDGSGVPQMFDAQAFKLDLK